MKNYRFVINGTQYEVDILSLEGGIAKIEVNGTPYVVEIQREVKQVKTPTIVRSAFKEPQKEIEKKSGGPKTAIKSPLPGIIVNLFVHEGDKVKKNQKLFSLEAMKMENEIKAERDGIIAAVKVIPGQSVLQEEVVMEMN
jgi:biotin carboxyl carrier protein